MQKQKFEYFIYGVIVVVVLIGLFNKFIKDKYQINNNLTSQQQTDKCIKARQHVNDYDLSIIWDFNKGGRISTPSADEDLCSLTTQTPTPTIPFSVKQQCAQDTYALLSQLKNETSKSPNQISYILNESTYSNKLNTCIASITTIQTYNGETFDEQNIYDTISQKLLSQFNNNDENDKTNFIPSKIGNVSGFDLYKYSVSIGLSH